MPGQVLSGIGVGATLPLLGSAALAAVPGGRYATASAVVSSARQLGGVLGIALLVVILGDPTPATAVASFQRGLGAVDRRLPRRRRPRRCRSAGSVRAARTRPSPTSGRRSCTRPTPRPSGRVPRRGRPTTSPTSPSCRCSRRSPTRRAHRLERATRAGRPAGRRGADRARATRPGRPSSCAPAGSRCWSTDAVVRELGPGQVLGELALLTGEPRSATVRARRDTTLLEIPRRRLRGRARHRPRRGALRARPGGRPAAHRRRRRAAPPPPERVSVVAVVGARRRRAPRPTSPRSPTALRAPAAPRTCGSPRRGWSAPTGWRAPSATTTGSCSSPASSRRRPGCRLARLLRAAGGCRGARRAQRRRRCPTRRRHRRRPADPTWCSSARPPTPERAGGVGGRHRRLAAHRWSTATSPPALRPLADRLAGRSLGPGAGRRRRPGLRPHRRAARARGRRPARRPGGRQQHRRDHRRGCTRPASTAPTLEEICYAEFVRRRPFSDYRLSGRLAGPRATGCGPALERALRRRHRARGAAAPAARSSASTW